MHKMLLVKASPTIVRHDDSTNGELSNIRVLILQPSHAITILIAPPSPLDIALIGTNLPLHPRVRHAILFDL